MTELLTQFVNLLGAVLLMLAFAMTAQRRILSLIYLFTLQGATLVLSTAVPPEQLYTEGPLAHEFPRTVSRLHEMQSSEFLALARRDVDTSLT